MPGAGVSRAGHRGLEPHCPSRPARDVQVVRSAAIPMSIVRAAVLAVLVLAVGSVADRVEASCTISTAGVAFGTYDVFSATALTSTGTISLDCSGSDRDVSIHLSPGTSGTYVSRTLRGPGGDVLNYNLFINGPSGPIWGNGNGGTSFYYNSKPGPHEINLIVYGRITAGQDVRAGLYADTVVATINF